MTLTNEQIDDLIEEFEDERRADVGMARSTALSILRELQASRQTTAISGTGGGNFNPNNVPAPDGTEGRSSYPRIT